MAMWLRVFWLIAPVAFLGTLICARPADSQSFVYEGCSQEEYSSGSNYENNLNSLLSTFLRQASSTDYYNASVGSGADAVYGLYDCRGDLGSDDCANCIKNAMSQISTVCVRTRGARIQLDGCFMHYDRINFFGQADSAFIYKTCSGSVSSDGNFYTHLNTVFSSLVTATTSASGDSNGFRLTTAGDSSTGFVHGLAQCEGDLSASDCNNCMNEAVQKIKDECGTAVSGQVYLSKCYVRYAQDVFYRDSSGNDHSSSDGGDDAGKTVAIIIGLLAGVALIVVFLSFLRQVFRQDHKG